MIDELTELGHVGYVVTVQSGVVVVEPPLDIEQRGLPSPVVAIVETSLSRRRISGGRLLAARTGAPLLAPVATTATQRIAAGTDILGFLHVESVLDRPDEIVLTMDNGGVVFVGSLDRDPDAGVPRRRLADAYPAATFLGTAGRHDAAAFAQGQPGPWSLLNAEAVALTNAGEADMFWADPRFVEPSTAMSHNQLNLRLAGPWAPTVVSLSEGPTGFDAIRLRPEALASSFTRLAGEREIVVHAEDQALAEQAAGFLVRLGLRATSWLAP